jgi:hypothetical protein
MKKFIGVILATTLLGSPFASNVYGEDTVEANPWYMYHAEDIAGHWAEGDLRNMLEANIIKGARGLHDFLYLQPDKSITRAEFTALVVRALELKADKTGKAFTDTAEHWAKKDINTASALGIISGISETEFKPDLKISRAEISAIVFRAFDPTVTFENGIVNTFTDLKSSHWAYNHLQKVNKVGIVTGTSSTTVSPDKNATRAEATVMLKRALWLEDVNLPDGKQAMDLIINNEVNSMEAVNSKDLKRLFTINNSYGYGLAHEWGKLEGEIYQQMFEDDEDIYVKIISEPTAKIVALSTRFIKVDVQDLIIDKYYTHPITGEEKVITEDKSGPYYLIKRGGNWKIYSSYFIDSSLYHELEGF